MKDFKIFSIACALFLAFNPIFAQVDTSDSPKEEPIQEEVVEELEEEVRTPRELKRDVEKMDPGTTSPRILRKVGKRYFKVGDYYTAIEFLSPYVDLNPEDKKRMGMLAEAYRKTRNYREAEDMYSRLLGMEDIDKVKNPIYYLHKFDMAKSATKTGRDVDIIGGEADMKRFKKFYSEKDKSAKTKVFKAMVQGAKSYYTDGGFSTNDSILVVPLPEEINQPFMELSPIIVDRNTLIFGSLLADTDEYYKLGKKPARQLYLAKFDDENKSWSNESLLPGPFNEDGYQITGGAYSFDQERFYFCKCPLEKYKEPICAIWKSEYRDGQWSEPKKLNSVINHSDYSSKYPTLGVAQGRRNQDLLLDVLYFSTDRPKSKGGYDIWYSVIDEKTGDFKKAKSCGSKVNSPGDEITPFYNRGEQALYFSSNGFPGLGGLDVFKAPGFEKKFESLPVNVLAPINSPADDHYFVMDPKQDQGFFVSNRLGGNSLESPTCCDDIYQFRNKYYIEIEVAGQLFALNDSVKEKTPDNLMGEVNVTLLNLQDGGDTLVVESVTTTGQEGYAFNMVQGRNYLIKAEQEFFDTKFIPFSTKDVVYSEKKKLDIGLMETPRVELRIPRLYFETNKSIFSRESERLIAESIVKYMTDYPDLKLVIEGHSDDVGSDKYNVRLSKKRAKAVYQYLVKQGIDSDRLEYFGYGEAKPVRLIGPDDKDEDYEEIRKLNRRVEFTLAGEGRFTIVLD